VDLAFLLNKVQIRKVPKKEGALLAEGFYSVNPDNLQNSYSQVS
jgi:hypothetical protein